MTLESSKETVAVLYDIENAPFEMLNYTLDKARRYQPCRTIVISDWDAHPVQKRWDRLLRRPGFTFRQIDRTFYGKNSLDSALYDSAQILYQEAQIFHYHDGLGFCPHRRLAEPRRTVVHHRRRYGAGERIPAPRVQRIFRLSAEKSRKEGRERSGKESP